LDLSSYGIDAETFELDLLSDLNDRADSFGFELKRHSSGPAIVKLIQTLYDSHEDIPLPLKGKNRKPDIPQVAVLVDEYDFPLFNLRNKKNFDRIREILHGFFAALKTVFDKIRLLFMTGINNFSGITISSGMNSIRDITFNPKYSAICGFTETEIETNFGPLIQSASAGRTRTGFMEPEEAYESLFGRIMEWYDGYSWDGNKTVLNPESLLNFLATNEFTRYWYNTGGPDFLEQANLKDEDYFKLFSGDTDFRREMISTETNIMSPPSILLRTGYLTIDRISALNDGSDDRIFLLKILNKEVRRSYADDYLIPRLFPSTSIDGKSGIIRRYIDFAVAFHVCDSERSSSIMSYIYADIAHQTTEHSESFYASHLVPALYYIDGVTTPQDSSGGGDADCVVQTRDGKIFVIEVKYHKYGDPKKRSSPANADDKKIRKLLDNGVRLAFNQIFDQGYALRILGRGQEVIAVAVSVVGRIRVKIEFKKVK
jgi:hypothetical protein